MMDKDRHSNGEHSGEGPSFSNVLKRDGLQLVREETHTLQVNVGLVCNQACRHCHLSAGPGRTEVMSRATADEVADWVRRAGFKTVDITGGAPELNPDIAYIVETFAALAPRLIFRSNLTALTDARSARLLAMLPSVGAVIVASFPSLNEAQADAQRGCGVFKACIETLGRLNRMGYGQPGSGLELDLVSNPTGAFLASQQVQAEKRFREVLGRKWGIAFNSLLNFSNVPLGRFRRWLERSGNLASYMEKLTAAFNPRAVEGVMCRTLVSVNWDGYLYDCDFNLARELPMGGDRTYVSRMDGPPEPGSPIATADHCFSCTAGAGFT
jgi:radical SAM/Cys-rich protein